MIESFISNVFTINKMIYRQKLQIKMTLSCTTLMGEGEQFHIYNQSIIQFCDVSIILIWYPIIKHTHRKLLMDASVHPRKTVFI